MKTTTQNIFMKNIKFIAFIIAGLCSTSTTFAQNTINTLAHYDLRPELLEQTDPPNIMIIFDNSGSMRFPLDAGFTCADPTGTWNIQNDNSCANHPNSRSFQARTGMASVFDSLADKANVGLMTYDSGSRSGNLLQNVSEFTVNRATEFKTLLGIESDAAINNGTIQSWGGTPNEGSLLVAYDYLVTENVRNTDNSTGGTVEYISEGQCPSTTAVILVTDGQSNRDSDRAHANGNDCTLSGTDCAEAAAAQLFLQDIPVYVVGFGTETLRPFVDGIAAAGSDATEAYLAGSASDVVEAFNEILGDIFQRASSGSSAAVSTSSNQDAGFFVQSSYRPLVEGTPHDGAGSAVAASATNAITETAYWTGLSRMLFVDPFGFVREDTNNNAVFDATNYGADRAVRIEVNDEGKTVFRRLSINIEADGTPIENGQGGQIPIAELNGLWELNQSLDTLYKEEAGAPVVINNEIKMPNDEIKFQRETFTDDSENRRYIMTNINGVEKDFAFIGDGAPAANFGDNPIEADEIGYLGLTLDQTEFAKNLIDWVRGADDSEGDGNILIGGANDDGDTTDGDNGFRNRTVFTDSPNGSEDYQRFLLGDAIHSTPVVVGAPSEPFYELYGDTSYKTFRDNNKNRRTVTYLGTNDGMIHAVNSGIYSPTTRSFNPSGIPLGYEMWAYIPESVLPHLRFLASGTYTSSAHIYGVDGPLVVKDVKVGGNWRTFLFASTGYGGFDHQVDTDFNTAEIANNNPFDEILKPSIVVLDVTDPENPPIFIDEIKENLGATTVKPTVFHKDGKSYIAIGNGPSAGFSDAERTDDNDFTPRDELKSHVSTNEGQVLIYELGTNTVSLVETLDGFGNGFIGDIASIDWDLVPDNNGNSDYDAIYFGLNSGSGENNDIDGKLLRVTLDNYTDTELVTGFSFDNLPLLARDRDQSWIFAGTGRVNAKDVFDSDEQNRMYGIQESFDNDGVIVESPTPDFSELINVTDIKIQNDGDLQFGPDSTALPAQQGTYEDDTNAAVIQTFNELADEIEDFHRGWFRDKDNSDPSERVPGRATTPGSNILTYIGFTPDNPNQCSVGGSSTLYNIAFSTGTAAFNESFTFLNPNNPDDTISESQVIANTLVPEFTTLASDKDLFRQELLESIGGATDPSVPNAPVVDNECAAGDTGNGVCVGADGTNPDCAVPLPGECGFGRKSFREIDFRYFR